MEVRLAEEKDLESIYSLGFTSYSEETVKSYGTVIDKEKARAGVVALVKQNSVFVAIERSKFVGAMVGIFSGTMFSDDLIYASMFFFMAKGYRALAGNFVRKIEELLKEKKINKFIIGNPEFNHPEDMGMFYKLLGFNKLETHYIRNI